MVRKAYEKLEDMGYINSIQGKGRYLKERHKQIELVMSGNESFSKKMLDKGYDFESENIFCTKIPYDEKIYKELGVAKEDEVYRIGRLRVIDKRPSAIHISYVAKSVFSDIAEAGKSIISIFEYYKSKGYKVFDSEKSILSISFPTLEEREFLQCSNLIPLLIVETNCIDKVSNTVLEYTKIIYRSDCFKYIVS
jgi:GntR family transcriptional regulator